MATVIVEAAWSESPAEARDLATTFRAVFRAPSSDIVTAAAVASSASPQSASLRASVLAARFRAIPVLIFAMAGICSRSRLTARPPGSRSVTPARASILYSAASSVWAAVSACSTCGDVRKGATRTRMLLRSDS